MCLSYRIVILSYLRCVKDIVLALKPKLYVPREMVVYEGEASPDCSVSE